MGRYAAVDLGAGSGRVILGELTEGCLLTREVHRFRNDPVPLPEAGGVRLCWKATELFAQVRAGLSRAAAQGPLEAIGIDTWGVDYGLLDVDGVLAAPVVSYRDRRTAGVPARVFEQIDPAVLYARTGTQVQEFNTIFQLLSSTGSRVLARADRLLLLPDLLAYWLTGVARTEMTNASTTGLLDPVGRRWSDEVLDALDQGPAIRRLLTPLSEPGTVLGPVLPRIVPEAVTAAGAPTPVVTVGSHDTASAVVGVPAGGDAFAFISSGTWSLVGLELPEPVLTEASRADNFTNELGVDGTVRYLRNVSGMWTLNHCLAQWQDETGQLQDLTALLAEAFEEPPLARIVDLNDDTLLDPGPMTERINALLESTGQPAARTRAQMVRTIMDSLALAYRAAVRAACRHSGRTVDVVHVVGGGSRNIRLCQATADATGLPVVAGPAEGTALGNLLVCARAVGDLTGGLDRLRAVGAASCALTRYEPTRCPEALVAWRAASQTLESLIQGKANRS